MEKYRNYDSKFRFALTAARRAKQIIRGSRVLVDVQAGNPITIAMEELRRGYVTPDNIDSLGKDKMVFSQIDDEERVREGEAALEALKMQEGDEEPEEEEIEEEEIEEEEMEEETGEEETDGEPGEEGDTGDQGDTED